MVVVLHERNRARARRCGPASPQRPATSWSSRTPTSSTTRPRYPKLVQPILDGKADVVYGSRFIGGESHRVLYFWHSVGNHVLTLLSNMFTNLNLTDMETCYKVFRREVIQGIDARGGPLRLRAGDHRQDRGDRKAAAIYEVAICYAGRTYEEGKKIGWRDGVRAMWCIWKYSRRSARRPSSLAKSNDLPSRADTRRSFAASARPSSAHIPARRRLARRPGSRWKRKSLAGR